MDVLDLIIMKKNRLMLKITFYNILLFNSFFFYFKNGIFLLIIINWTALFHACFSRNFEAVRFLIDTQKYDLTDTDINNFGFFK